MKDATEATRAANRAALALVPLADRQSFEDARRGFIEALGDKLITRADGRLVWTLKGYEFLESENWRPTASIRDCGATPGSTRPTASIGSRIAFTSCAVSTYPT